LYSTLSADLISNVPRCTASQTDGWTDGQTDNVVMPIDDHTACSVRSAKRILKNERI